MAFLHHSWSWMGKRYIGLSPPLHPWSHRCDYRYPNYHVCMKSAAESPFEAYVDLVDIYRSKPIIHWTFLFMANARYGISYAFPPQMSAVQIAFYSSSSTLLAADGFQLLSMGCNSKQGYIWLASVSI